MARPATIDDTALLQKLSGVFRDVGFDGASLSALSAATGLKRASLYHRFPGGKEQMAREVLLASEAWLEEHVFGPLGSDAPPGERIGAMVERLDELYAGGRQACLLNMLSAAHIHQGPFTDIIGRIIERWIAALAGALGDAGLAPEVARARAERAIALLQGSLVVARGTGSTAPFRAFLDRLPGELLDRRNMDEPA